MSLHLVTGYAGREHVTSADHGSFNIAFVGAGEYVFNRSDNFEATIIDNETVRIGSGDLLMQGRHIRQMENTQTTLTFESGVSGLYRKDMIVAEYRKDAATMIESALFNVIKGVPALTEEEAVLPTYTHGDITEEESDRLNQMPLYEVDFEEDVITAVKPLFTMTKDYAGALDEMVATIETRMEQSFENAHTEFLSNGNIVTTYDDRKLTTVFNQDGSITEQLSSLDDVVYSSKLTEFNADGSITETVTLNV